MTVASDPTEGYVRFARACAVYGIPYRVGGLGRPWRGGDMKKVQPTHSAFVTQTLQGPGGGQKVINLKELLVEFKDKPDTIFLFSDRWVLPPTHFLSLGCLNDLAQL